MRAALLLLVVLLPLAAAQEGAFVAHEGWREFRPAWRHGPATYVFRNQTLSIPEGARYATDGATYLYAYASPDPDPSRCAWTGDGNETVVVADASPCTVLVHPAVGCGGPPGFCVNATGQVGSSPPAPTPASQLRDDCGRVQTTYCVPSLPAPALVATLAVVALGRRRRGLSQAPARARR